MGKSVVARLAAAAVGGVLAVSAVAPALAQEPVSTQLYLPHQDQVASGGDWEKTCESGQFDDDPVPVGYDGWHFVLPDGAFVAVNLTFDGDDDIVSIDSSGASGGFHGWIRDDQPTHAFLFTPAGWTLEDGTATVEGGAPRHFTVGHACVGEPGPSPTPTPAATSQGSEGADDGGSGLPDTGTQVGGLVILGGGFLAAGIALTAVRRRRNFMSMIDN